MATRPSVMKLSADVVYWNILLYADSGTGKTVFAGSDKKALFLDPDKDGTISAARMGSEASKIKVKQWEDVKNVYEWYEAHPEELADFDIFVIDSLSEMQYMARDYVLRMTAAEKIRKDQDPKKMQLQDYGIMHELVEQMVRGFNDLQINVLWTATAKKVEDADGNAFLVPEIQGKGDYGIAMKMVSLMTSYGYMRVELHDIPAPTEDDPDKMRAVKRRVIYWEDTGTIRGKDRTCSLAPFTVNASLAQVRRAIAGELKRDSKGRLVAPAMNEEPKKRAPRAPKLKVTEEIKQAANPANTKDNAVDLTDSVPQHVDEMEADLDVIQA